MVRVFILICTLLFLRINLAFTQDYRIENITSEYIRIEKGLSQNTVNCILQDIEGYIWAGTWSGLNRFDGYSFKTLTLNMVDPSFGLTHATITGLAEDSLGYIWAGCTKGLNRVSKRDFSITQFTVENSAENGMASDSINVLYTSKTGLIWIGTNQGILVLNPVNLKFTHIEHNPRDFTTLSSNKITCFTEDSTGSIWVGTSYGLNKLNPETGQAIRYYADNQPGTLATSEITALGTDKNGVIWIGSPIGLQCYKPLSRSFFKFPFRNSSSQNQSGQIHINCIFPDKDNNLWLGTRENGLLLFDVIRQSFINMQQKIPESDYFSYTSFSSIIQDRNGLFWLGTAHKGLVKLVPDPHAFYEIIRSYSTFGIAEPIPGNFWFGTQDGVLILNRENKTTKFIKHTNTPNALTGNQVSDIFNDPPYVWVATRTGLNRIKTDNLTNKVYHPDQTGNSIAGDMIWHINKDSNGHYWFATNNGLSRLDGNTGEFTSYRHDPNNSNSLSNNYCLDVFELSPGILLISTQYGLNMFNETTGRWTNYLPVKGNATTISTTYILGVFRDSRNELWVFTNGGGFCSFDPVSGTFERYTTTDGLCDNIVYGILEDKDGIFWLPTNNGLSRFDHRNDEFTNFDVQDGLLSNEFNKNSIYADQNGEVFLGGVNGVIAFFPQTTIRTSKIPVTRITRFTAHGSQKQYDVPLGDTIRIPSSDNTFSISFAALDYLNPFKNQFTYFLENSDKVKTSLSPGLHQVDYRNVVPGLYNFKLTGTNSLGVRSNEIVTTIIVVPAWYQTKLFLYLTLFTVLLILSTIAYLRIQNLRTKHEMEKRLLNTRNELIRSQKFALRSQMNPHFIFNSLNSIQNFVLKNDVDSANYYLSNFSILMRKVLEYSQYNYITLHEELEMIQLYLKMEHMRFSKKFELNIHVDPKIDQHLVKIPPMLLQPYLENAILHGLQLIKHKGLLEVLVTDHEDHMVITIADNGIGREKARAIRERSGHKSRGLANIEKRIQLYNSISDKLLTVNIIDLTNEQGEPSGTRVEISVAYEMEDHSQEILE
ncbi:MAG: two-component regulator propeller domain-containing protein [Bacteroidales bacterium]|jgi:ligand-binding sensor domain-containing protein